MPAVDLATLAEAVRALRLDSPRALHRLIESGAPSPADGKRGTRRYDVAAIRSWMTSRRSRESRSTDELTIERIKLTKVQRQRAALDLREAKKQLLSFRDAETAFQAILGAVRAEMLSVSRRAVLQGLPREHEPLVKELIVSALRELAPETTVRALVARAAGEDPA